MTSPLQRFADSHAHVEDPAFDEDREAVFQRAAAAGVDTLVLVGLDESSSRRCRERALERPDTAATAGLHPHEVAAAGKTGLDGIAALLRSGGFQGVGETGLDRVRSQTPLAAQRAALEAHMGLARELSLPVVLHCRECFDELFEVLRGEGRGDVRGVLHCFTGGLEQARTAVDLGLHVSFSGIVTFPRSQPIRQAAAAVPVDRILVETDCPYLAPVPHRGSRNEPAFVADTALAVAALRGEPAEETLMRLRENARRLFRIPPSRGGTTMG